MARSTASWSPNAQPGPQKHIGDRSNGSYPGLICSQTGQMVRTLGSLVHIPDGQINCASWSPDAQPGPQKHFSDTSVTGQMVHTLGSLVHIQDGQINCASWSPDAQNGHQKHFGQWLIPWAHWFISRMARSTRLAARGPGATWPRISVRSRPLLPHSCQNDQKRMLSGDMFNKTVTILIFFNVKRTSDSVLNVNSQIRYHCESCTIINMIVHDRADDPARSCRLSCTIAQNTLHDRARSARTILLHYI